MRHIFKQSILGAVAAAALMAAGAANAQTIRFAHVDPADWQTSKKGAAALIFKNIVEGESDMTVELFPASALGGETELVQQAQDGTTQVVMVSGAMQQICPAAAVLDIPYMFPSAPIAWEVLDGEFGKDLAQHCLDQTGLRTLAYGETGFRNFTNSQREIKTPEDMKGLKFRVQDIPLYVEMVNALGGEPTPIAWAELPNALSTGVVDGQENPVGVIYNNNLHTMQKYMILDGHIYATDFLLINDAFFNSLDDKQKNVVARAAKTAGLMGRAIQEFTTADGIQKVQEAGMQVYSPTEEDLAKFREAAQPPVREFLSEDLGDDAEWIGKLDEAVSAAQSGS